jgi:hypothetical protein
MFWVQVVVPVNMRFAKGPPRLENRFACPLLTLPVHTPDPIDACKVSIAFPTDVAR